MASKLARVAPFALIMALAIAFAACSSADDEPASTSSAAASTPQPASSTDATAPRPSPDATLPPQPTPMPERVGPKQWDAPPDMVIDASKKYSAVFELAKGEEFTVELYADKVPVTVNNFVFLSREGFYDGVTFHRVLEGFMAQTGDPTGTGRGGPGYRFADEFHSSLIHDKPGVLSMANSGPNTNGSQFFITFVPTPHLDGRHAVFGEISDGMATVNGISVRDPMTASTPGDVITRIRIVEE